MAIIVEYRGGIPEISKTGLTNAVAFPDGLVVSKPGFSLKNIKIPFSAITDVSLVSEGAKKNNYVLNVEYEGKGGFKSCVILTGKDASKLYGDLQKSRQVWLQRNPGTSPDATAALSFDVAAEIQKFHELMEKGIITEDEFNAKKAQLLGL